MIGGDVAPKPEGLCNVNNINNTASNILNPNQGGTGINAGSSATAYGVVCGGTTASSPFQVLNALGSSGNVLTSNGAGALPTWQANAAAAALVKISSATASSSASISFTGLSATYLAYLVIVTQMIPASSGTIMQMRMSTNNGSSYDSTSAHYVWVLDEYDSSGATSIASSGGTGPTTLIDVIPTNGTGTGQNAAAQVWIYNPSAAQYTNVSFVSSSYDSTPRGLLVVGQGSYLQQTAVNAIQFFMSSGNIASGTFELYGVTA